MSKASAWSAAGVWKYVEKCVPLVLFSVGIQLDVIVNCVPVKCALSFLPKLLNYLDTLHLVNNKVFSAMGCDK